MLVPLRKNYLLILIKNYGFVWQLFFDLVLVFFNVLLNYLNKSINIILNYCLTFSGHGADVKCVDWHPSKSLLASGSKDNQQPIKLWDPRTGHALAKL